jgi:pimeloyl-ACP methyl ester carboxylesterase
VLPESVAGSDGLCDDRDVARLVRDGVGLAYEEAGAGGRPVLLVHGILCDRRYLAPQFGHFSAQRRTVSVDLRGHGESDAPEQDYTIDGFAGDLAWLSDQLGLERPLVVGHSLGGIVALALAASRPDLVGGIVALDSVLVPPEDRSRFMSAFFARLRSDDYLPAIRDYFTRLAGPTASAPLLGWILEEIGHVPRRVGLSTWENGFFGFDTAKAAAACRVPFLYVDAGTANVDLERLRSLCPSLVLGRTVGAGHFHQLEVPNQINAMIERFDQLG